MKNFSNQFSMAFEQHFSVIPWLDHGIQKTTKNTNIISIFNWIL
ncbi:hypothetical protein RMAECT_1049 [Rickettsia rhipicephali str. Ect]|uniref:Uncharacterized protein n=1 Tax=Rickettsia rhipicephali str. Ect TaxID=1359199 RepID=A0A0F3PFI9_RICRH|nr:hypothetical protein RMAECT_1049 [Rickettsia rhipicephali str. Ect]